MSRRVVFDTTTVVSALLFEHGRLAWLRGHWRTDTCVPLLSSQTADEIERVLGYPKFRLDKEKRQALLAEYLPFCEPVTSATRCPVVCRDENDQPFLDLAEGGHAEVLVSGDKDLLALSGQTRFRIETPEAYARSIG